jgi:hypothetical protein
MTYDLESEGSREEMLRELEARSVDLPPMFDWIGLLLGVDVSGQTRRILSDALVRAYSHGIRAANEHAAAMATATGSLRRVIIAIPNSQLGSPESVDQLAAYDELVDGEQVRQEMLEPLLAEIALLTGVDLDADAPVGESTGRAIITDALLRSWMHGVNVASELLVENYTATGRFQPFEVTFDGIGFLGDDAQSDEASG